MAKPKVAQGDTPYSVTVETSDEPTGKVAQQESPVVTHYDLDTKPSGNAKPASEPTTYHFDAAVETKPTTKAVTTDDAENKAVKRTSTKAK